MKPPPIIDSTELIAYAINDEHIIYTDCINLLVGVPGEEFEKVGEMPYLAICKNHRIPDDYLLFFCNNNWQPQGTIAFKSVKEAKAKAERGYNGISSKWVASPYSAEDINKFLIEVYQVDPTTELWNTFCSFCGKESGEVNKLISSDNAVICNECVIEFSRLLKNESDI